MDWITNFKRIPLSIRDNDLSFHPCSLLAILSAILQEACFFMLFCKMVTPSTSLYDHIRTYSENSESELLLHLNILAKMYYRFVKVYRKS